ncbi:hypothetical protein NDU88_006148 [Pleurodeles waltl]|uniref:Uncharacterized protein n=1 Tax=Pleurodeles waltl TaxID=8319 RepID=A0AAV7UKP2_PLEWA|nr:hypothetical protein NDU88_006148 [Pleurodeles waltl]
MVQRCLSPGSQAINRCLAAEHKDDWGAAETNARPLTHRDMEGAVPPLETELTDNAERSVSQWNVDRIVHMTVCVREQDRWKSDCDYVCLEEHVCGCKCVSICA